MSHSSAAVAAAAAVAARVAPAGRNDCDDDDDPTSSEDELMSDAEQPAAVAPLRAAPNGAQPWSRMALDVQARVATELQKAKAKRPHRKRKGRSTNRNALATLPGVLRAVEEVCLRKSLPDNDWWIEQEDPNRISPRFFFVCLQAARHKARGGTDKHPVVVALGTTTSHVKQRVAEHLRKYAMHHVCERRADADSDGDARMADAAVAVDHEQEQFEAAARDLWTVFNRDLRVMLHASPHLLDVDYIPLRMTVDVTDKSRIIHCLCCLGPRGKRLFSHSIRPEACTCHAVVKSAYKHLTSPNHARLMSCSMLRHTRALLFVVNGLEKHKRRRMGELMPVLPRQLGPHLPVHRVREELEHAQLKLARLREQKNAADKALARRPCSGVQVAALLELAAWNRLEERGRSVVGRDFSFTKMFLERQFNYTQTFNGQSFRITVGSQRVVSSACTEQVNAVDTNVAACGACRVVLLQRASRDTLLARARRYFTRLQPSGVFAEPKPGASFSSLDRDELISSSAKLVQKATRASARARAARTRALAKDRRVIAKLVAEAQPRDMSEASVLYAKPEQWCNLVAEIELLQASGERVPQAIVEAFAQQLRNFRACSVHGRRYTQLQKMIGVILQTSAGSTIANTLATYTGTPSSRTVQRWINKHVGHPTVGFSDELARVLGGIYSKYEVDGPSLTQLGSDETKITAKIDVTHTGIHVLEMRVLGACYHGDSGDNGKCSAAHEAHGLHVKELVKDLLGRDLDCNDPDDAKLEVAISAAVKQLVPATHITAVMVSPMHMARLRGAPDQAWSRMPSLPLLLIPTCNRFDSAFCRAVSEFSTDVFERHLQQHLPGVLLTLGTDGDARQRRLHLYHSLVNFEQLQPRLQPSDESTSASYTTQLAPESAGVYLFTTLSYKKTADGLLVTKGFSQDPFHACKKLFNCIWHEARTMVLPTAQGDVPINIDALTAATKSLRQRTLDSKLVPSDLELVRSKVHRMDVPSMCKFCSPVFIAELRHLHQLQHVHDLAAAEPSFSSYSSTAWFLGVIAALLDAIFSSTATLVERMENLAYVNAALIDWCSAITAKPGCTRLNFVTTEGFRDALLCTQFLAHVLLLCSREGELMVKVHPTLLCRSGSDECETFFSLLGGWDVHKRTLCVSEITCATRRVLATKVALTTSGIEYKSRTDRNSVWPKLMSRVSRYQNIAMRPSAAPEVLAGKEDELVEAWKRGVKKAQADFVLVTGRHGLWGALSRVQLIDQLGLSDYKLFEKYEDVSQVEPEEGDAEEDGEEQDNGNGAELRAERADVVGDGESDVELEGAAAAAVGIDVDFEQRLEGIMLQDLGEGHEAERREVEGGALIGRAVDQHAHLSGVRLQQLVQRAWLEHAKHTGRESADRANRIQRQRQGLQEVAHSALQRLLDPVDGEPGAAWLRTGLFVLCAFDHADEENPSREWRLSVCYVRSIMSIPAAQQQQALDLGYLFRRTVHRPGRVFSLPDQDDSRKLSFSGEWYEFSRDDGKHAFFDACEAGDMVWSADNVVSNVSMGLVLHADREDGVDDAGGHEAQSVFMDAVLYRDIWPRAIKYAEDQQQLAMELEDEDCGE